MCGVSEFLIQRLEGGKGVTGTLKLVNVNFFPKARGRLFGLSRLSLSLSSVRVIKHKKKKKENILQIISTLISLFY